VKILHRLAPSAFGLILLCRAPFVWAEPPSAKDGAKDPAAPTPAPPATPASEVIPPVLQSTPTVAYPEGASGDVTVVLALTVDEAGSVTLAKAFVENDPFSSAAEAAARTWRFAPATRAGKPLVVKIRFEVVFREPKPADPPVPVTAEPTPAPVAPEATPKAPAAKTDVVEDVRVRGERTETSAPVSLSRAEVRQLPGAFGDPFRAIEALPGVTPIVSGLPFFYIRGAPPGNIGYFVDQIRVPYLFHAGAGPSVIHPGLIERVDLHPGAAPARYGRYAGGMITAETVGPRAELHGEGNVRLFDIGVLAETGFADGKGTALLGGRYSYTAAILSLIAKDTELGYRDYQARVSYDVTPDDRLTLVSFGAYDLVAQTTNGIRQVLFGSEFYRADLRYDKRFNEDTKMRVGFTLGLDQSRIPNQPRNSKNASGVLRFLMDHRVSEHVTLRGGADAVLERLSADERPFSDPEDPDTRRFNALFPPRNDINVGAWVDAVLKFGIWELTPGLRLDLYTSGGAKALGVDPRLASRINLNRSVRMIHTFGLAHQPPSFLIPVPGLAIGSLQGGLQETIQSSAGIEADLPLDFVGTVTAFENIYNNMSDTLGVNQRPRLDFKEPRSQGAAVGLEVYLKRRLTKHLGGYLSYTFSRSLRTYQNERFLSTFDRPHVANAAVSVDLGRNWRAGVRFLIYSGAPVVPQGGGAFVAPPRSLSPERDPLFYRFDARLEKKWILGKKSWLAFVVEMMNVTLHKETLLGQEIGPVSIPSLGLEGAL
jgi:TonB-dependent Receptor Plug Domain